MQPRNLSPKLALPSSALNSVSHLSRGLIMRFTLAHGSRNGELSILKSDKRAIFTAAGMAQKAVDWLNGIVASAGGGRITRTMVFEK